MIIHVLNYGLSNLLSVQRAITALGHTPLLCDTPQELAQAQAIILPGVGAFRDGMAGLNKLGLVQPLNEQVVKGTPLLGICLGMQMLFEESDEFGLCKGLGYIPGRVEKIPATAADGSRQRVPQVGWNGLHVPHGQRYFACPLLATTKPGSEVYFVHSYEAKPTVAANRLADTKYGGRRICAAAGTGNVFGTQFHPEKSGEIGLAILQQYLSYCENNCQ